MKVWILTGVSSDDNVIIGVFKTEELAKIARDLNEESYNFYNIKQWCVENDK